MGSKATRIIAVLVVVTMVASAVATPVVAADDDLVDVGSDDGPGASADGSTSADSNGTQSTGEAEYRGSNGSNRTVDGAVEGGGDGASVFVAANQTSEAGYKSGTIVRCNVPADSAAESCNVTRFDRSPPEPEPPGERNASVEDAHADVGEDGAAAGANVTGSDNDEGHRTIAGFDCDTDSAQVCTLYAFGNGSQGPDAGDGAPGASVDEFTVNVNESSGLFVKVDGAVTANNDSNEFGVNCQVNQNSSAEDCTAAGPGDDGDDGGPGLPDEDDLPGDDDGDDGDGGPSLPDTPESVEDVEELVDFLTPVDRHLP